MFEDTTTFQNPVLDSPDIVLRRFQRCMALEHQQNNAIDCNRELALKISSLRKILRENKLAIDRHKSRYQKLLNEVKTQEDELQKLCAKIEFLNERLENIPYVNEDVVNSTKTIDAEVSRLSGCVAMYEDTFGLRIVRTKRHHNIQIIFSGCCEDAYTRLSYVVLRLKSEASNCMAQLVECNPPIKDIEKLVEYYNISDNTRNFLLILRQRFVKYYKLRKKADSKMDS
nr:Kinetochore Ndc80 complex subunit Spc25 [Hymenolepis microstoma]